MVCARTVKTESPKKRTHAELSLACRLLKGVSKTGATVEFDVFGEISPPR